MTLVAALSGFDGAILFARYRRKCRRVQHQNDTQAGVWDLPAFRLGIAGATTDGTYADMLQEEIAGSLGRISECDLRKIHDGLEDVLTTFYAKHIWPRAGEKPQMEYLAVIQPLPSGHPEILRISETAANIVSHQTATTIGVGCHLADYLFKQIFSSPNPFQCSESISFLCGAGVYVAKEVRENIEGVGPVDRVAIFNKSGEWDELYPVDISKIEENLSSIQEFMSYLYSDAMDAEKEDSFAQEGEARFVREIRRNHQEWYQEWREREQSRRRLRQTLQRRAANGQEWMNSACREKSASSLRSQFLESKHRGGDHVPQCVEEQIRILSAIEAEFHLLQVGRKMLGTHPVPRSHDAALQKRERVLDCVGVNVTFYVDLQFVTNRLVPSIFAEFGGCSAIDVEIVGEKNLYVLTDIFLNEFSQRPAFNIISVKKTQVAAALTNADHDFFVTRSASALSLRDTADIRFVHLDFAREHRPIGLHHCVTDAMAEIPRGFIADSDGSLNLAGRNSFLRFAEQERSEKPRFKGQVRIIEHGASGYSELVIALFAVEQFFFGFEFDGWHLAARAFRAGRPAEPSKQFAALFVGREQPVYVN